MLKNLLFTVALLFCLFIPESIYSKNSNRYCYQIKIYHLKNIAQENRVDKFLKDAYLPALHRTGIKHVGVFKAISGYSTDRLIYVFIPFQKLDQFKNLTRVLENDKKYLRTGKDYLNAVYNDAPYTRIESILLEAFIGMPEPAVPNLTTPNSQRFYELRSYESGSEGYSANKIKMFNEFEMKIFKKLDFNAVFYGRVLSGSKMPNLMYMTTFSNKADRDTHWAAFTPEYNKIKFLPEFENNVSKNEKVFLYPTDYSDF
jgi:PII-like signaling protein